MTTTETARRSREEICDLGKEILRLRIEPTLTPADKGMFVAINVDSREYEIDEDDFTALRRLKDRASSSNTYIGRAGYETAYEALGMQHVEE